MSFVYWVHAADDIRTFIQGSRGDPRGLEGNGIWVEGVLAGALGMTVDRFNAGDIGYWLSGAFEGRGLMSDSCRVLVDHAFNVMRLHRVTICAEPDNARSRAIPERLGFKLEATLREALKVGDRYADLALYGLLATEWPVSH